MPKPLIATRQRDIAGSARESSQFQRIPDYAWVPGYSEKRMQNDDDQRRGRQPSEALSHRLQWVRVLRPDGRTPDLRNATEFQARGYIRVTKENIKSLGIDVPPNASLTAEGAYRVGDVELFACPAARAAANEDDVRRDVEAQTTDTHTSAALHRAGSEVDRVGNLTTSKTEQSVEVTKG